MVDTRKPSRTRTVSLFENQRKENCLKNVACGFPFKPSQKSGSNHTFYSMKDNNDRIVESSYEKKHRMLIEQKLYRVYCTGTGNESQRKTKGTKVNVRHEQGSQSHLLRFPLPHAGHIPQPLHLARVFLTSTATAIPATSIVRRQRRRHVSNTATVIRKLVHQSRRKMKIVEKEL